MPNAEQQTFTKDSVGQLRDELDEITRDGIKQLVAIGQAARKKEAEDRSNGKFYSPDWEFLSEEAKEPLASIRARVPDFGARLLAASRVSALIETADETEIRRILKAMMANLTLKTFEYTEAYVAHDEDRALGLIPADQHERVSDVADCLQQWRTKTARLKEKLLLISPASDELAGVISQTKQVSVQRFRARTAFIIMQIDEGNPHLEDVKNSIKEVFKEFGITAVRSDEIQHSDVITQRVLDEIETSEFLIADLTGERPSVYYEVGYAHATNRRPILFREKGSRLHFDLAVHNVPEYKNVTELKDLLRKRLEAMTGKSPAQPVSS